MKSNLKKLNKDEAILEKLLIECQDIRMNLEKSIHEILEYAKKFEIAEDKDLSIESGIKELDMEA